MIEELVYKLYKVSLMEGFIWVLQNLFPWILFAIVNAVRRILKRNEIYSDVHKSGRVKDILSSVAENKARLGASHVIITRIHNGIKWLNGDHMNKISIYKQFTVFRKLHFTSALDNVKLSEVYELIQPMVDREDDIISVKTLPDDFQFKKILKNDKIRFITVFRIQKSKIPLGYIFLLYEGENEPIYDETIFKDFRRVANEIAKEFA